MSDLAAQMLTLVQNGVTIPLAAAKVYGHANRYYRKATKLEKHSILRARREFESMTSSKPADSIVYKTIPLPASLRDDLQAYCDNKNEPVNTFVKRLILQAIK